MSKDSPVGFREILIQYQDQILEEWIREQLAAQSFRPDLIVEKELRRQSSEMLALFTEAVGTGSVDISDPEWSRVKEMLTDLSRTRAIQGFTPSETATFVFSLKQPLFQRLTSVSTSSSTALQQNEVWKLNMLLDKLSLYTTETFIRSKEDIIIRQQREMIELSTPVVQLWEGILALPLIGTLDSERTQVVMENLLSKIVETGSYVAIIDITGVPTVDTLVAQHLLKTVAAARLMGADCIISGIRPQIAQTIVHLGVDLSSVITKASMAEAFKLALLQNGVILARKKQPDINTGKF